MSQSVRFSPSKGWEQIQRWWASDAQSFVALGGLFFLLPFLIIGFFGPAIDLSLIDPNETDPQIAQQQIEAAIGPILPWMFGYLVIAAVGQLTITALLLRSEGPTVGEAIRMGFAKLGFWLLTYFVIVAGVFLLDTVITQIFGLGGGVLILLGSVLSSVASIYLQIRVSLAQPALVAEDIKWPLPMLLRSWQLTDGNVLRIFGFVFIIMIVMAIAGVALIVAIGVIFSVLGLAGPEGGLGNALLMVITGIVLTIFMVVAALLAPAVYRQLTSHNQQAEVFS